MEPSPGLEPGFTVQKTVALSIGRRRRVKNALTAFLPMIYVHLLLRLIERIVFVSEMSLMQITKLL